MNLMYGKKVQNRATKTFSARKLQKKIVPSKDTEKDNEIEKKRMNGWMDGLWCSQNTTQMQCVNFHHKRAFEGSTHSHRRQ